MSRQKAGLRKEHELAQSIYEATGGSVMPLRAGWSGNSAVPAPDLLVPYKGSLRAVEIKTSSRKRMVVERDELADVVEWSMNMNEVPTFPYLAVKFSYYEMVTMRLKKPWDLDRSLEILVEESPLEARITRGGNVSFGSPKHYDCDVIGANASPGDNIALLRDLRQDSFANVESADRDTVGVHEIIKEHPDYWSMRE